MITMGTVWDRTTEFVRERFAQVLPIALLTMFVPPVVTGSLEGLRLTAGPALAGTLAVVSLVATLVTLWGQLAITGLAIVPSTNAETSRRATRRLGPIILMTLLLVLAVALLALPVIVLLVAGGLDLVAMASGVPPTTPPGNVGWVALYMVVLVPVLLWLIARLLLLTPVVLMERNGFGAFGRSFRLTRGLALRIIGVIVLYAVVSGVAVSAVTFVFGSILRIVAGGDGPVTVAGVLTAVAVAAVSAALAVLQSVFIGKLYAGVAGDRHEDVFA